MWHPSWRAHPRPLHAPGSLLGLAILLAACSGAPPLTPSAQAPAGSTGAAPSQGQPSAPKRIVIGVGANLPSPHSAISAPLSGADEVMQLVTSGLTAEDEYLRVQPVIAEAVPSTENGLWTVFPDGRMETTWRLREGATWHDGMPVTSDDLLFTMQVARDPDVGPFYSSLHQQLIETVQAPDPRTVRITWKQPYIQADRTFNTDRMMPRHLLEAAYLADKASFANLPYWTSEYVSNGPYKLREWETGVHALLDAYDGYRLGRTKIDQIQIRFIADNNTMLANVLADSLDVLVGARHLAFDQALEAQARWTGGTVVLGANGWSVMHPQMLYSNPVIVQNVQFRRAMFHAIDRQAMADTLQGGLAPVAHSVYVPSDPMHQATLSQVVKYDYDPRRAAQLIEGLGYRKGTDGTYVDASTQRLISEVRTTGDIETTVKQMFAIQDYWNRLGVATEAVTIPPQRQQDREYRSTFCCFEVLQGGHGENGLIARRMAGARTPENGWRGAAPTNYSNYVNEEHDALIARYLTTIPMDERTRVAGQILHQLTDQVLMMPMYYIARPTVVRNGLTGTLGRDAGTVTTFNVTQWDLK